MGWDPTSGPRVIAYNMGYQTYEYINRTVGLGVFEGDLGAMKLTPEVRAVIDALHTVLAGGEVKIEVVHRGNPDIIADLNERMAEATEEANDINRHAGYYFTILP